MPLSIKLCKKIILIIKDHLSDDLLTPKFKKIKFSNKKLPNTFGHCYVSSEAAYYLLGGKDQGWTPHFIIHEGSGHWYLRHQSGFVLDVTYNQFKFPINYSLGRGKGFLTKTPSRRAKNLLFRISLNSQGYNYDSK